MLTFAARRWNYNAQMQTEELTPKQRRRLVAKERLAQKRAAEDQAFIDAISVQPCHVCGTTGTNPCVTKSGKPAKANHKGRTAA